MGWRRTDSAGGSGRGRPCNPRRRPAPWRAPRAVVGVGAKGDGQMGQGNSRWGLVAADEVLASGLCPWAHGRFDFELGFVAIGSILFHLFIGLLSLLSACFLLRSREIIQISEKTNKLISISELGHIHPHIKYLNWHFQMMIRGCCHLRRQARQSWSHAKQATPSVFIYMSY